MAMQETERLSRRERCRRAGLSGNYWYVAELDSELAPGQVKEVVFWGTSIALYRGHDGQVRAVENRCAHRQLRLSEGAVEGNLLVCNYHGWKYDGCGRCVAISHELGRRSKAPDIRVRSYPVRIKYGFVWIFPGDPDKAEDVPLPHIPQLEGARPWSFVPIDVTIRAHFSMIVENVCDFNHAYLHKRYKPFVQPTMRTFEQEGDRISVTYDSAFDRSRLARLLAERGAKDLDAITIWYDYPYQRSDIGGRYLHWLFMLPVDEQTTRCFFVFLFDKLAIPVVNIELPGVLRKLALRIATEAYIKPLLGEDKWALEEEQRAHHAHAGKPSYEFNPIISHFQKMTLDKWAEYGRSEAERLAGRKGRERFLGLGAGLDHRDLDQEVAREVEQMTDSMSTATTGPDVAAE